MNISPQSIIFFITMTLYILVTSSSYLNDTFLQKLLTVFVITFCIQYLSVTNSPISSWIFVFIPIFYILAIITFRYLITV